MALARRRTAVSILSPTTYLRHHAIRKGAFGGNKAWMVMLVFLYAPRLTRRAFGREEVVVARAKVPRGETISVQTLPKLAKAERKAIMKGKYSR
jgi:hypothetical protein